MLGENQDSPGGYENVRVAGFLMVTGENKLITSLVLLKRQVGRTFSAGESCAGCLLLYNF